MAIRVVQLGTERAPGEGPRLGTVRRPPRGVKKEDYAREDFFDVWMPELSPSTELLRWVHGQREKTPAVWKRFMRDYRGEMKAPAAEHLLKLLAALSKQTHFSVGCYCDDYSRCHRSVLRELLVEHGADVLPVDDAAPAPARA